MSYELDTSAPAANDQIGTEPGLDRRVAPLAMEPEGHQGEPVVELDLAYEDLDPDIRSIMLSNDKLVGQLERSLLSESGTPDSDERERDEDYGFDVEVNETGKLVGAQMGLLEELVSKTIEDHGAKMDQLRAGNQLIRGSSPSKAALPAQSTKARSRRAHATGQPSEGRAGGLNGTNMPRFPSQIDEIDRLLCGGSVGAGSSSSGERDKQDERVYRDCDELSECESGGQCTIDSQATDADEAGRLERRARCRCPIGRGGNLCQKRKFLMRGC